MHEITTIADVDTIRSAIEDHAAGGQDVHDGRVDWHAWLDRFEQYNDVALPSDMESPVIRKIQRIVRDVLSEVASR